MYTGPSDKTRYSREDYATKELEQKLQRVTKMKLVTDFPADPKVTPYGESERVLEVTPFKPVILIFA